MKIIVDMQGLQSKASGHRGVGRYTENLVAALLRHRGDDEILLALNGRFGESVQAVTEKFAGLISPKNIVVWQQRYPARAEISAHRVMRNAGEAVREAFLNSFCPDIIFSTNLQEGYHDDAVTSVRKIPSGAIYCTTLHDLVPLAYKNYLNDDSTRQWYFEKISSALRSDILITVSHSSRADIVNRLRPRVDDVHVIANGYDAKVFNKEAATKADNRSLLAQYGIVGKFLFYIGGCDEHKNIPRLVHAFAASQRAIDSGVCLVLAGRELRASKTVQNKINELGLEHKVLLPGYIDETHLPAFYGLAIAFIFPSLYEGFGLPVLEALACGAAVIASDTPAVAELIEDHATFDPHDVASMAVAIERVVSDESFRSSLCGGKAGVLQRHSWDRSAKDLLDIWRRYQSNRAPTPIETRSVIELVKPELQHLEPADLALVCQSIADSFPRVGRSRLYVDVSTVVQLDHKTGIQRVTRALASELLADGLPGYDTELVYSTVTDPHFNIANRYMWGAFGALRPADDAVAEFGRADILVFLDLHPGVALSKRKYIKELRQRGVKVYHVVYDILPVTHPETFWDSLCKEFRAWAELLGSSDGAVCISKSVATELGSFARKYAAQRREPFKIDYFHLGCDITNSAPSKGLPADSLDVLSSLRSRPTFLMVGTIEPRKAHRQALAAFDLLWQRGLEINLVIIGKFGWGMGSFDKDLMGHQARNRTLFWLNGISDEYLDLVYANSTCLLAASEGEGFGLPLIEAARHGVPLLIRDIPIFREVAGAFATYFPDRADPQVIEHAVDAWLQASTSDATTQSTGMPFLNWKQSTKAFLMVLNKGHWDMEVSGGGLLCPGNVYRRQDEKLSVREAASRAPANAWALEPSATVSFLWGETETVGQMRVVVSARQPCRIRVGLHDVCLLEKQLPSGSSSLICELLSIAPGQNSIQFTIGSIDDGKPLHLEPPEVDLSSFSICVLPPVPAGRVQKHDSSVIEWHGFSSIEDGFRWTDGLQANLVFHWNDTTTQRRLQLVWGTLGRQSVSIYLNNDLLFSEQLECWGRPAAFKLSNLKQGYNNLRFELPDAKQPGGPDQRHLALALFELTLL